MQLRRINHLLPLVVMVSAMVLLSACGGEEKPVGKQPGPKKEVKIPKGERATLFQVDDEVFSIPSPIETSFLLKNSGTSFRKEMLNDARNATSYSTKFFRALNLGIYGADLGYVTLYDQTQDAMIYFKSCKKIGDELGVAGAFDDDLLKRFQENLGDQDSLLILTADAYSQSDEFLKNNDRAEVGALVLAGGWLESLHFASLVANEGAPPAVTKRIGEQKVSLENLIKLLQKNANDEQYEDFIEQLVDLWYLFEEVKVQYVYQKPTVDVENKTTFINSKTEVEISEAQLKTIYEKVESIRNQIVS